MIYNYIKKHFNVIFFITITLISMIISFNSKDLQVVFICLEMIYIIVYFMLEQLTGKEYKNDILCINGILLGVVTVYILRVMKLPDISLILVDKLNSLKIVLIPFLILLLIIHFIVKPMYAKTKDKTIFNIVFSIFLLIYFLGILKFCFYMVTK